MIGFGSYFCYDNPGALQNEIVETMHVSTARYDEYSIFLIMFGCLSRFLFKVTALHAFDQLLSPYYRFSLLYSWYSTPNIVLPIIGGTLIDR